MPRTKTTHARKLPAHAKKTLDIFADPFKLIEEIENDQEGTDDPYWKWVRSLTDSAVANSENLDVDDRDDVRHLRGTRGGRSLELLARQVGFVIGFEYAARLLSGRGDKLPGGVR